MKKLSIRSMVTTSLFAAILCILSPWSIPTSIVPITLSVFVIFLIGLLLPPIKAVLAVLVYIILGIIGLPVFSNMSGGIGVILGPTGGFIMSYLLMVLVQSLIVRKEVRTWPWVLKSVGSMMLSLLICYTFGSLWFMFVAEATFAKALLVCVVPFIAVDVIKMVAAFTIAFSIYRTPLYSMLRK